MKQTTDRLPAVVRLLLLSPFSAPSRPPSFLPSRSTKLTNSRGRHETATRQLAKYLGRRRAARAPAHVERVVHERVHKARDLHTPVRLSVRN